MYHFDDDGGGGDVWFPLHAPDDLRQKMLHIMVLDPNAHLLLSEQTKRWYLTASLDISDGATLRSVTEHRDTPAEAVRAYFKVLCDIGWGKVIVTRQHGKRQHWRWNGSAFRFDHHWKPNPEKT